MDYAKKRKRMVENQIRERGINNNRILEAFRSIPQENFLPDHVRELAYSDSPISIGYNVTISQPYVVAYMIDNINPQQSENILEIGSGSGYLVSLLSKLCNKVVGVEIIKPLVERSQQVIKDLQLNNIEIVHVTGKELPFKDKEFDKIIVSAATTEIPKDWNRVLKEGGRIIVPKDSGGFQILTVYRKENDKLEKKRELLGVQFVPLTD